MRYWKTLSLVGLAVAVSLLAAACGTPGLEPEEGVMRVWLTWGDDPAHLQALFDQYSQAGGQPVRVTMGVDSDEVLKAMAGPTPPDVVVLSSSDLVRTYDAQGLVEPLDPWIEAAGIDLDDIYPAPLAQCQTLDGTYLCLPWGCDVQALFWNKDLFAAAGLDPDRPPQTMEELVTYAEMLTVRDEGDKLSQIGFIPDFSRSHTGLYARMFGGFWWSDDGTELTANARPMVEAANWQRQFYDIAGPREIGAFVASFTPYRDSRHAQFAGRRLSCQQCHRSGPRNSGKIPGQGFYAGKVAMLVDSQWQAGPSHIPLLRPELNYGVAPVPPPAGHPERANTAVAEGPVVVIPARVADKQAAIDLLAWMMSPDVVAEVTLAHANLPTSRAAAKDPRFQQIPNFRVFMDLLAHPNARHLVTTPISPELNRALSEAEQELLHKGGDPVALLNQVQAEFAPKLQAALAGVAGP